jgi:citrate synthase
LESYQTKAELSEFSNKLKENRNVPKEIFKLIKQFPKNINPMDVLRTAVSFLSSFDPDVNDNSQEANYRKAIRLIDKIPSIVANIYRIMHRLKAIRPKKSLPHAANFLYMLRGDKPNKLEAEIMDKSFIAYAEHEFNASTTAARVTASTLSDIYSSVVSAIGTSKGPRHGGANEETMKMLLEIGDVSKAEDYIMSALAVGKKIPGFVIEFIELKILGQLR